MKSPMQFLFSYFAFLSSLNLCPVFLILFYLKKNLKPVQITLKDYKVIQYKLQTLHKPLFHTSLKVSSRRPNAEKGPSSENPGFFKKLK